MIRKFGVAAHTCAEQMYSSGPPQVCGEMGMKYASAMSAIFFASNAPRTS